MICTLCREDRKALRSQYQNETVTVGEDEEDVTEERERERDDISTT